LAGVHYFLVCDVASWYKVGVYQKRVIFMKTVKRQVYDISEIATLFGIGRNHAYEAAKAGMIPTIRLGKRIVAPRAAIDRMLGLEGEPEPEAKAAVAGELAAHLPMPVASAAGKAPR
jgi:hypothetical protein